MKFYTARQLADLLHCSPRTLERWRRNRTGPPWVAASARHVLYSVDGVASWLAERSASGRGSAGAGAR